MLPAAAEGTERNRSASLIWSPPDMPAPDMSMPAMPTTDLSPDLSTVQSTESPAGEYRSRLSQQRNFQRAHQRRASLIGYTAVFFLLLGVAVGLVILFARA